MINVWAMFSKLKGKEEQRKLVCRVNSGDLRNEKIKSHKLKNNEKNIQRRSLQIYQPQVSSRLGMANDYNNKEEIG